MILIEGDDFSMDGKADNKPMIFGNITVVGDRVRLSNLIVKGVVYIMGSDAMIQNCDISGGTRAHEDGKTCNDK
jgi:hypothetical protein